MASCGAQCVAAGLRVVVFPARGVSGARHARVGFCFGVQGFRREQRVFALCGSVAASRDSRGRGCFKKGIGFFYSM